MKCKTSWFLIAAAVVATLVRCFADTASASSLPESEVAEIKKFFSEFMTVRNNMDVDGVKKMAGIEWERFSRGINRKITITNIEIVDIIADKATNVVTKVTEVNPQGESFSAEVIFMMKKANGDYLIDKIRLPESERRHEEFETAYKNFRSFIDAINAKNTEKLKDTLTFGDADDFDSELAARNLLWVVRAIDNNLFVISDGFTRTGIDEFWGNVLVPRDTGGTNVLHEVIFKGLKIDRAAPPQETYEEFCKRIKAEQKAARKQYDEKRAAEYKRQNAEVRERLKKELKDIGALK